jgi:hypothetical protein
MILFLACVLLAMIVMFLMLIINIWKGTRENRKLQQRIDDLMSRFMARNYQEYALGKRIESPVVEEIIDSASEEGSDRDTLPID